MQKRLRPRRWLGLGLLWCLASPFPPSWGQGLAPVRLPGETLRDLGALLRRPELRPARVGILVEALGTRSEQARKADRLALQPYSLGPRHPMLFARDPDKAFIPASNMKLLTAAAILEKLGGEFRYETQVRAWGEMDATGCLTGDLYLCGAGDPSLDYEDLANLADQLAKRGLKEVKGSVVGDDSLFPSPSLGYGWSWEDLPYYYAMEISALSLHRNQVEVIVRPGDQPGQPARVEVQPANDYVQVVNRAMTVPTDKEATLEFDRPLGHTEIHVSGNIPCGTKSISQGCSVPHPALYAATVFGAKLREQGIVVCSPPRTGSPTGETAVWATVQSQPLRELLPRLHKNSDNLYAELFLRTLGKYHSGTASARSGGAAIEAFLRGLGLDTSPLRVADGSGLSRFNLISPRLLVGLLEAMAHHREAEAFYASLPIAGVDGTLAGRFRGTPAAGNVHAKTGYLSQVSTLSGYVTTADGQVLAVAILVNHFTSSTAPIREIQDQIFTLLAKCRWRS